MVARACDGSLVCARFVALAFDAPKVAEVAPPLSPERAAALRIAHRYELGERNRELLELLASGHRIPTIARTLHLAQWTVCNRISSLGGALGVHGQTGIVSLVVEEAQAH